MGALLLWLALAGQTGSVERAEVFARGSDTGTPLFTFERTVGVADGQTVAQVRFIDPAGAVVATERVSYINESVVQDELVQHQIQARYTMSVTGDQAVFERERDGSISQTSRQWTPDTLTVDQLRAFVATHWDRLTRGEEISFPFVALERARIVRFTLKHRGTVSYQGRPAVAVRMEASRLVLRWLAPEVDLVFTPDGTSLLESTGPLPVKIRRGDRWLDLDARMVWTR